MPERHEPPNYYGGQAVIEGVMIRGPRHMAVAARAPDGSIVTHSENLPSLMAGRLRRIPLVRGVIVLYETLALGIRSLTWSSQVAAGAQVREVSRRQMLLSLAFTLIFVGAVFFAGPVLLTAWIGEVADNDYLEIVVEGVVRLALLIGYIWLIGRLPEIRRVFAYHGAEHRTIHAFEHGRPLIPAVIREYPNAHPRCGTAFLLTVMVISLFVFLLLGTPPIWIRIVERLVLVPVIASFAYELLRIGQRYGDRPPVSWLYAPNLWLQALTTRDPDDDQIEVAVVALERALAMDGVGLTEPVADEPLA